MDPLAPALSSQREGVTSYVDHLYATTRPTTTTAGHVTAILWMELQRGQHADCTTPSRLSSGTTGRIPTACYVADVTCRTYFQMERKCRVCSHNYEQSMVRPQQGRGRVV